MKDEDITVLGRGSCVGCVRRLTLSSFSRLLTGRRKRLARIVHHMFEPSCRMRQTCNHRWQITFV